MPDLLGQLANGACRFLAVSDTEATDAQGYPNAERIARTNGFIPCSWIAKTADEKTAAEVVRGLAFYEITLSQIFENNPVVIKSGDRVELRLKPSDTVAQTLEVVAVVNQAGAAWKIFAVDIDE